MHTNTATFPQAGAEVFRASLQSNGNLAQSQAKTSPPIPSSGLATVSSELIPRIGSINGRLQRVAQCLRQTPQSGDEGNFNPPPSDLSSIIQQAHYMLSYCEGIIVDIENSLGI